MMKRRKGTAAGLLIAMLLGLVACGDDASNEALPDDPTAVSGEVTMWSYPIGVSAEKGYWDERIAEFEREYPNVDVDVVVHPWERREERLTTAVAGNQAPDIVYFNEDFIPKGASQRILTPLDDLVADDRDDFREGALEAFTYEGQLYGVPLLQAVNPTIYYKAAMDAIGIGPDELPRTWDQLLDLGERAKAQGVYLTTYNGSSDATLNTTLYPLIWQAGGEVLTEDGTGLALDSDAGRRALTFLRTLVENEYVPAEELTTNVPIEQTRLARGEVLMSQGLSWPVVRNVHDADGVIVGPPLEDQESISYGTVGGLSLLADSEDVAAAKAWIAFLTSTEQMASFTADNGFYATRRSTGALYEEGTPMGEAEKYLDHMRTGVTHARARELMDTIRPHLQALLLGETDVKGAIQGATQQANGLLSRG